MEGDAESDTEPDVAHDAETGRVELSVNLLSDAIECSGAADGKGYIDDSCLSTGSNTNGICATNPKEYEQGKGFTATGWMPIPWDETEPTVEVYIYKGRKIDNSYKRQLQILVL